MQLGRCAKTAEQCQEGHSSPEEMKMIKCGSARVKGDKGYPSPNTSAAMFRKFTVCTFSDATCPYLNHQDEL